MEPLFAALPGGDGFFMAGFFMAAAGLLGPLLGGVFLQERVEGAWSWGLNKDCKCTGSSG